MKTKKMKIITGTKKSSEIHLHTARTANPVLIIMNASVMIEIRWTGMKKLRASTLAEINRAGKGHPLRARAIKLLSPNCVPVIFFRMAKVNSVSQLTAARIARISSQFWARKRVLFMKKSPFINNTHG
jgi:hypothetical protein